MSQSRPVTITLPEHMAPVVETATKLYADLRALPEFREALDHMRAANDAMNACARKLLPRYVPHILRALMH